MIKRTLFFGNPSYLSVSDYQLVVDFPDNEKSKRTIPIEDLGFVVLEHPQITITSQLLALLNHYNVGVINCDHRHMPSSMLLPLNGHSEQNERFREQLLVSVPLKKNLWQQTIKAKIANQARLLADRGVPIQNMMFWVKEVQSGDKGYHEGRAAAYYWQNIFDFEGFKRGREEAPPNNLLNYGYAILRAVCARALVGSGLLPALGIHHANKYNAYCLADDIMEPYRPFVDAVVCFLVEYYDDLSVLTTVLKSELLKIPALDVTIDGKRSPLMVAMSRTTNSLHECYCGISRKILYPTYE